MKFKSEASVFLSTLIEISQNLQVFNTLEEAIIIFCAELQPLAYLLLCNSSYNLTLYQFYYLILYFVRPQSYFELQANSEIVFPLTITILIMFIVLIIYLFYISIHISQLNLITSNNFKEKIKQLSQPHQVLLKLLACYIKVHMQILFIPLIELHLSIFSNSLLQTTVSSDVTNFMLDIISVINVIIIVFLQLLFIYFTDEAYQLHPTQKIYLSGLEFVVYFLRLIQPLIYLLYDEMYHLQVFIIVILVSLKLILHFMNLPYLDPLINKAFIYASALNINLVVLIYVFNIFAIPSHILTVVILLSFPLVVFIFSTFWDSYSNMTIFQDDILSLQNQKVSFTQLQYQIGVLLFNFFGYNFQIKKAFLLGKHRERCLNEDCICKVQDEKIQNYFDAHEDRQFYEMKKRIVQNFGQLIVSSKMQKQSQIFFLHYISALNILDLNTIAFQHINGLQSSQIKFSDQRSSSVSSNKSLMKFKTNRQRSSNNTNQNMNNKKKNKKKIQQKQRQEVILHFHISQDDLNYSNILKITLLQHQIKQGLYSTLTLTQKSTQIQQQLQITNQVQQFLNNQSNNHNIQNQLMFIIQSKIQYLQLIKTQFGCQHFFEQTISMARKLINTQRSLEHMYQQFPSQRMQRLLAFYHAEVMNEYFTAYSITNFGQPKDESSRFQPSQQQLFDLLSSDVCYLTLNYKPNGYLAISTKSSNSHQFFQYQHQEFKSVTQLEQLIPPALSTLHPLLAENFISTGVSKYFRSRNFTYILLKCGYLNAAELFFEINLTDHQNLSFAAFLQSSSEIHACIYLDSSKYIGGISRNLSLKLGWRDFNPLFLSQLSILAIIPQFDDLLALRSMVEDVKMYFLKSEHLHSLQAWYDRSLLKSYYAKLKISEVRVRDTQFYVVWIHDLKEERPANTVNSSPISESEIENFVIHEESIPNRPQILLVNDSVQNPLVDPLLELHPLASPCHSRNQFLNSQQQRFYQMEDKISSEEIIHSFRQQQQVHQPNSNQKQYDQHFYDLIVELFDPTKERTANQQKNLDDQASQIMSISGFRRSRYYSKYLFFSEITKNKEVNTPIKGLIVFTSLMTLTILLYTILNMLYTQNELERFVKEISMLQIKAFIMGPVDTFNAMEFSLENYKRLQEAGLISKEERQDLSKFANDRMNVTFYYLKQQFVDTFNNQYLLEFFKDFYVEVQLMDSNHQVSPHNITLQQSLIYLLQTENTQTRKHDQLYPIINYMLFAELFEHLSHEVLEYSEARTLSVTSFEWSLILPFTMFYEKLLSFLKFIQERDLQLELDRMNILQSKLEEDRDIIFKYQFDLDQREIILKDLQDKDDLAKRQKEQKPKQIKLQKWKAISFYLLFYIILLCYQWISFSINQNYLAKYLQTAKFFSRFNENVAIITGVYVQRELCYSVENPKYSFQNDGFYESAFEELEIGLHHLEEFLQFFYDQNLESIHANDRFRFLIERYQQHDICELLDEEYREQAQFVCDKSLDGNLKLGLVGIISFIKNSLEAEESVSGFKERSVEELPVNEMEGAIVTSDCLKALLQELNRGLLENTERTIEEVKTLSWINLGFWVVFGVFVLAGMLPYLREQLFLVKNGLLHFPLYTIVLENTLERQLRLLQRLDQL